MFLLAEFLGLSLVCTVLDPPCEVRASFVLQIEKTDGNKWMLDKFEYQFLCYKLSCKSVVSRDNLYSGYLTRPDSNLQLD